MRKFLNRTSGTTINLTSTMVDWLCCPNVNGSVMASAMGISVCLNPLMTLASLDSPSSFLLMIGDNTNGTWCGTLTPLRLSSMNEISPNSLGLFPPPLKVRLMPVMYLFLSEGSSPLATLSPDMTRMSSISSSCGSAFGVRCFVGMKVGHCEGRGDDVRAFFSFPMTLAKPQHSSGMCPRSCCHCFNWRHCLLAWASSMLEHWPLLAPKISLSG